MVERAAKVLAEDYHIFLKRNGLVGVSVTSKAMVRQSTFQQPFVQLCAMLVCEGGDNVEGIAFVKDLVAQVFGCWGQKKTIGDLSNVARRRNQRNPQQGPQSCPTVPGGERLLAF